MERLIGHFRKRYEILIGEKTARRLTDTVRAMGHIDPQIYLGVTGSDVTALIPRRIDVTLAELRAVIDGRRDVA
ncbi:MAG TPA: hypothetical protein VEJ18_14305 [Planctomycetota bacterium]|nr:hypothetical protein [Planctomycetota bacterium]